MELKITTTITLDDVLVHLHERGKQDYVELKANLHPLNQCGPDAPRINCRFPLPPDLIKAFDDYCEKEIGVIIKNETADVD